MTTEPRSFRLSEADRSRLERLSHELGCSSADVVRFGLVALATLLEQGYKFRGLDPVTIYKRSPDRQRITFYEIAADGTLVEQGEAGWEGS